VRESQIKAVEILSEGSTIPLARYELGNAVWAECFLRKRISQSEGEKMLQTIFGILHAMEITILEGEEEGIAVLKEACKLNLTYYDAAYIYEAIKTNKVLATDDKKLAKAAEKMGLKTLSTSTFSK
jgi:predicted nucleic acid-binding protein